ncbi:uncharacterized protein UV8b_04504 [Ustilaginoidea virens]|nr:uncharacterized protein UV8b_04504 [Ustilaginoidea virens]QUC20263.1 hypothetical protein UV8b_04504 [Ustilaginoidea virens]
MLLAVVYFFHRIGVARSSKAPDRKYGLPQNEIDVFASHAINNTVVIVPVNTGMMHLVENMICSLTTTRFDPSSIVFWALDKGAKLALDRKGLASYRDPSLYSTSGNSNRHGNTEQYHRMMRERPKFFLDVLSSGYDMLIVDADTVFWQSPLLLVPSEADKKMVDIVYSTDAREFYTEHDAFHDERRRGALMPPICNGLFWMKSNKNTVALWTEMLGVFEAPWWIQGIYRARFFQDDQRGIDVMLNDGRAKVVGPLPEGITKDKLPAADKAVLNVRLLDQTAVVNGQLLMFRAKTYQDKLDQLRAAGKDRIAAHMNWDTSVITKEDGARKKNIYFLDDDGKCRA